MWTTPIYHANAGTPTATISVPVFGTTITIPYSSSFTPSPDSDSGLAVIDDANGCEYEFDAFDPSTMSAHSEATFNIDSGSGVHADDGGVTGSDISTLGGIVTAADVASGSINHALRYATPINSPDYVAPATHSDGTNSGGVPEGELMRLDPTLDLSQFGLTPYQLMVAKALQTYGAYDADSSGSFKIYTESTVDGSSYSSSPLGLPWSVASHLEFGSTTLTNAELTPQNTNHDPGCAQQVANN